jgi:hypothetical protein
MCYKSKTALIGRVFYALDRAARAPWSVERLSSRMRRTPFTRVMARTIAVTYRGEDSSFDFLKLDRSKLYGSRRRLVLDRDGEPCRRAELTEDGFTLIQAGMTAQGYFDEDNRWVPTSELIGLDAEGMPAPRFPRTLGVPQLLRGPVQPEAVLDCRIQSVYVLSASDMSEALAEALMEGEIFEFPFGYRTDHHQQVGFLVANDEGVFALVGDPAPPQWCELAGPVVDFVADEEAGLGSDLDFEMF